MIIFQISNCKAELLKLKCLSSIPLKSLRAMPDISLWRQTLFYKFYELFREKNLTKKNSDYHKKEVKFSVLPKLKIMILFSFFAWNKWRIFLSIPSVIPSNRSLLQLFFNTKNCFFSSQKNNFKKKIKLRQKSFGFNLDRKSVV